MGVLRVKISFDLWSEIIRLRRIGFAIKLFIEPAKYARFGGAQGLYPAVDQEVVSSPLGGNL